MRRRWLLAAALAVPAGWTAFAVPWSPATYRHIASLERRNPDGTALIRLRGRQAKKKSEPFRHEQRWVPLDRVSPHLQRAVVAAEDGGFYRHGGVEWGLLRDAFVHDLKQRRWARGASTITQQVARNLYLSPAKRPSRKVKEIVLALHLERRLSKRRILEIYLNIAEWGPGIFGAEAASRKYFGKPAADLTPDEAVALAAVLPSPRKYDPRSDAKWVAQRKAWVRRRVLAVWGEPLEPPRPTSRDGAPEAPAPPEPAEPEAVEEEPAPELPEAEPEEEIDPEEDDVEVILESEGP